MLAISEFPKVPAVSSIFPICQAGSQGCPGRFERCQERGRSPAHGAKNRGGADEPWGFKQPKIWCFCQVFFGDLNINISKNSQNLRFKHQKW